MQPQARVVIIGGGRMGVGVDTPITTLAAVNPPHMERAYRGCGSDLTSEMPLIEIGGTRFHASDKGDFRSRAGQATGKSLAFAFVQSGAIARLELAVLGERRKLTQLAEPAWATAKARQKA